MQRIREHTESVAFYVDDRGGKFCYRGSCRIVEANLHLFIITSMSYVCMCYKLFVGCALAFI